MIYLLDTNIISELAKKHAHPLVKEKIYTFEHVLALAAPSWQELLFGYYRMPESHRKKMVEDIIAQASRWNILPFCKEAAAWLAFERTRLVNLGKTPSYIDAQIAAIAVRHNLILVTRNRKDFINFKDLQLEDWFSTT